MSPRPGGVRPRIILVDNVDSFTFMLADQLAVAGASVSIERNDALTVSDALGFDGVVISPGPGRAEDAGVSVALASACVAERKPLLGVCLGHQALALACGGTVGRTYPVHGKVSAVRHDRSGLLADLPMPFEATRYHSLAVIEAGDRLVANAWSEDGAVMAMRHRHAPAHGVQFHPESIASAHGVSLLRAFVDAAKSSA